MRLSNMVLSPRAISIAEYVVVITLLAALLTIPLYPLYLWTQVDKISGANIARIMAMQTGCTMLLA